jgi:hypothetical protein
VTRDSLVRVWVDDLLVYFLLVSFLTRVTCQRLFFFYNLIYSDIYVHGRGRAPCSNEMLV